MGAPAQSHNGQTLSLPPAPPPPPPARPDKGPPLACCSLPTWSWGCFGLSLLLECQRQSPPGSVPATPPPPSPIPSPPHWSSVTMATASLSGRDYNLPISSSSYPGSPSPTFCDSWSSRCEGPLPQSRSEAVSAPTWPGRPRRLRVVSFARLLSMLGNVWMWGSLLDASQPDPRQMEFTSEDANEPPNIYANMPNI